MMRVSTRAAAICVLLCLGRPTAVLAIDRPAFPTYDSAAYCTGIAGVMNDNAIVREGCLKQEATYQRRLRALWPEGPPSAIDTCVRTQNAVKPSYQGLAGCLSIMVGKMWIDGEVLLTPR